MSGRVGTDVMILPYLPAIRSVVLIIKALGHSDDKVVSGVDLSAITQTRLIPGSLETTRLATSVAEWMRECVPCHYV